MYIHAIMFIYTCMICIHIYIHTFIYTCMHDLIQADSVVRILYIH